MEMSRISQSFSFGDLSYDLNGNVTSLTRREGSSEGTTWSWSYNGNRRSGHSYGYAGPFRFYVNDYGYIGNDQ